MNNKELHNKNIKAYFKRNSKCELCGSKQNTQTYPLHPTNFSHRNLITLCKSHEYISVILQN